MKNLSKTRTGMDAILSSHLDQEVILTFRADRANSPDGSMLTVRGVLAEREGVNGGYMIVTQINEAKFYGCTALEFLASDIILVHNPAPVEFLNALNKRSEKIRAQETEAIKQLAAEILKEEPKLIVPA